MGLEEQVEERAVLEAIYPDELQEISDQEFRISIALDIPPDPNDETPSDESPTMLLNVRYPANYPDEAPILDLLASPNPVSHPHFSVSSDRDTLLADLSPVIEESLGAAMIFTLVSTLKDAAEQLVADRRAEAANAKEEMARAAERIENAKFHGEPVTPESFTRWREGFLKEMAELREREEEERLADKRVKKEEKRLTGKQIWESGLAGKVEEEDGEDEEFVAEGVAKLKVEA